MEGRWRGRGKGVVRGGPFVVLLCGWAELLGLETLCFAWIGELSGWKGVWFGWKRVWLSGNENVF